MKWNEALLVAAKKFAKKNSDATVIIFSTFSLLESVVDEAEAYGFDIQPLSGKPVGIWHDHIHPTTKAHDILANGLAEFLECVTPTDVGSTKSSTQTCSVA